MLNVFTKRNFLILQMSKTGSFSCPRLIFQCTEPKKNVVIGIQLNTLLQNIGYLKKKFVKFLFIWLILPINVIELKFIANNPHKCFAVIQLS